MSCGALSWSARSWGDCPLVLLVVVLCSLYLYFGGVASLQLGRRGQSGTTPHTGGDTVPRTLSCCSCDSRARVSYYLGFLGAFQRSPINSLNNGIGPSRQVSLTGVPEAGRKQLACNWGAPQHAYSPQQQSLPDPELSQDAFGDVSLPTEESATAADALRARAKERLSDTPAPRRDWHSRRQSQQQDDISMSSEGICQCVRVSRTQHHAEYLQRSRRFGSRSPAVPISPTDRQALNAKQRASEERLDQMFDDSNVQLDIHELENCRISLVAQLSGQVTRELWELMLTSLRCNLHQSMHASWLDVPQAVILQKSGGPAAVRRDVLRLVADAIVRRARLHKQARILGSVDFEEDINKLAERFSPGSPLTFKLCAETYPKVHFKRPYKGLKLRVPRQSYARGHFFRMTEDFLLYKYSQVADYPDPQPPAKEGDTVLLRVDCGWFEEPDGSPGLKIPPKFIAGTTTLDLVKPWIPRELLENVLGLTVGETRTIRVAIPFQTSQLLYIYDEQAQAPENAYESGRGIEPSNDASAGKLDQQPEGSSLVPLYLKNIANNTKNGIFEALFGEKTEAGDLDKNYPTAQDSIQDEQPDKTYKSQVEREEREPDSREIGDETHHIDCLIQVECLGVRRRMAPKPDDDFFIKTCGMGRAKLWEVVEGAGEELVKSAASKHALGAAAEALDSIAQVEIPESLIDAQASVTWKQQLKARDVQGEDNTKLRTKQCFLKWKAENKRGVENILRTSFAIQAVCRLEGLKVDEAQLQKDLAKLLLQAPVDSTETLMKRLYKKAQAALAYDFIVQHADVEYYVDDTPAQVTVQTDGDPATQQGVRVFPKGANIEQWHKMREHAEKERDAIREKSRLLYVDAKSLKKYTKDL